jgi:hypothetical protein
MVWQPLKWIIKQKLRGVKLYIQILEGFSNREVSWQAYVAIEEAHKVAIQSSYRIRRPWKKLDFMLTRLWG